MKYRITFDYQCGYIYVTTDSLRKVPDIIKRAQERYKGLHFVLVEDVEYMRIEGLKAKIEFKGAQ